MEFNIFSKILEGVKKNPVTALSTNTAIPYLATKALMNKNVQGALSDTSKMYEQKAQGIQQWGAETANAPGYVALGNALKRTFPKYAGRDSAELGKSAIEKFPDNQEYKTIVDSQRTALGQGAKILGGIGSMAVSAPGMVAGGLSDYGQGASTIAGATTGQERVAGGLQAGKGILKTGFGVATGATPIASTVFGGLSGTDTAQEAFGYIGQKSGDIGAGTAKFLGGNEQVQEQARGFGEQAVAPAVLYGLSKGGSIASPYLKTGMQKTGQAISSVPTKLKAIPKALKKAPGAVDDMIESGVEKLATKALGSSDGTAELFKATSPSYNILAKSKDIGKIKQKARVADEAVVEAGFIPKTTTERVDAYKATMKKVWGDVEKARGAVAEKYKSDSIADTIVSEVEKMKVNGKIPPSLEADVTALLKEADFYRSVGDVSLPDLGVIRSNINARLTFGDKTQFSDAYNAVMQKVITAIKEGEDAVLTRNAGKTTSDLLSKYGALRSMLDDVIKQDIKASRAKGLPIEESFGRISGLAEMAGGVGQLVMNPKQAIPSIVSGGSKVILGKVAGKLKDTDYLIRTGYEKLLQSKNPTDGTPKGNPPVVRPNSSRPTSKQKVKPKPLRK